MHQQIERMQQLGRERGASRQTGAYPTCQCGSQGPERIRERDILFGLWCAPEGPDIVECQSLEIGIVVDVQAIIPHHKVMALDLPEDSERHKDEEGRHGIGEPGGSVTVGGRRAGGKTLMCPVREVAHCCSLALRVPEECEIGIDHLVYELLKRHCTGPTKFPPGLPGISK